MDRSANRPRRKLGAVLIGALAASAAGAALYLRERAPRKPPAKTEELAALRAELEDVKRRAARPQIVREVRTEQIPASVAPPRTPEPTEAEEPSPEEQEYRRKVINEARSARCEETFRNEAKDPAWSEEAARLVYAAQAERPREGLGLSADCRSTLCRVTFRYASPEQASAAGSPIPTARPWPGRAFSSFNLSKNEGVMYLAREGFDLPSVDPESLAY